MKKKWWIIAIATIAACIGLAFVIPALRPWRPGVTKENFDRIEIGMTYDEAVAILGPPTYREPYWVKSNIASARIFLDRNDRIVAKFWFERPDDRTVYQKLVDQVP